MRNGWNEVTIDQLIETGCASLQTGPFGTALKAAEYSSEGVPLISVREIKYGTVEVTNDTPRVNKETTTRLPKFILRFGDIVFGRKGGVDRNALIRADQDGWFLGSDGIRFRMNDSFNHAFISYQLRSPSIRNWLLQNSEGSTMASLNQKVLGRISLQLPPRKEQDAIAHILGTLDDKIELNRKMNETLEAMAQTLFKSWFVDFDPVLDNALVAGNEIPDELQAKGEVRRVKFEEQYGSLAAARSARHFSLFTRHSSDFHHLFPDSFELTDEMGWIPKGWEVGPLGDFLVVKRGGSPRPIHDYLVPEGLPWVKISDATGSSTRFISETKQFIKPEGLKKTVLLDKGSLILSNSATPGLPKFLNIDSCVHDGWLFFPSITHFSDLYLYQLFLLIREELISQGNGSVFTNLKTDILRNQLVLAPQTKVIREFDHNVNTLFSRMQTLNSERQSLTNLRDTLLPKLLSGEIRVPDAEVMVENVV